MEESLKFLINNFPGVAIVVNSEGQIERLNQQAYKLLEEYRSLPPSPEQLRGINLNEFHNLQDSNLLKTLQTWEPTYGYREYQWKEKERKILYCNVPAKLDDDSQGVIVLNIDLSYRADSLSNLAKSLKENTNICFSQLEVGIVNLKGEICYINQAVLEHLGLEMKNIIGKHIEEDLKEVFVADTNKAAVLQSINEDKFIQSRKFIKASSKLNNLNSPRVIDYITFPIKVSNRIIGGIYFGMNIEKMLKYSQRIKQTKRIENIGEMAFRVIHEIRNPLQEIIATAQLGELKSEANEIIDCFAKINSKVQRVNRLLNEILHLSNPTDFKLEKASLTSLLDEIAKSVNELCRQEGIELIFNGIEEDIKLIVDKKLFVQAILNIIENAIDALRDYEDERKIIINFWTEGQEILISIYNSGPPIPKEIQANIFDVFTSTKGINGTGLGLSLAYYIITKLHQGEIWFESNQAGTIFFSKIKREIEEVDLSLMNNKIYKGI